MFSQVIHRFALNSNTNEVIEHRSCWGKVRGCDITEFGICDSIQASCLTLLGRKNQSSDASNKEARAEVSSLCAWCEDWAHSSNNKNRIFNYWATFPVSNESGNQRHAANTRSVKGKRRMRSVCRRGTRTRSRVNLTSLNFTMGICGSSVDAEASNTYAIDKELRVAKNQMKSEIKMLLLGMNDTGSMLLMTR